MSDVLFSNNNKNTINKIIKQILRAEKKRNFFIIAAIALTTFMIASLFSIGMSYYESINMQEKRLQGSISQMAFFSPTEEQLTKISSLNYIKTVGIGVEIAQVIDMQELGEVSLAYVDQTQWEEMFCPTFTNIVGTYPIQENEIMLSRYILEKLGVDNPEIGMQIPITYTIIGTEKVISDVFVLTGVYTGYTQIKDSSNITIYCSSTFAEKNDRLKNENKTVNIIFKDKKNISEYIQKLKSDISFVENQQYTISPAFDDNNGDKIIYLVLFSIIIFFMFAGYLLIYNVMYISVSKDVRFYGMLKTLGTAPKQIRKIVIGQMYRLCFWGIIIGCIISAIVSLFIVPIVLKNSGIDTGAIISFSPLIYIVAVVFSIVTALFGAITPAVKASQISPIEALKYTGNDNVNVCYNAHTNGKVYRMALRNIFREKKRAVIVLLSLFLSATVFLDVITIINSINLDNYIKSEYNYDFSFYGKAPSYFLDDDFVQSVSQMDGIRENAITRQGTIELLYSPELEQYSTWLNNNGIDDSVNTEDAMFQNVHTIKGVDTLVLDKINDMVDDTVNAEAFENGEIAIINVLNNDLLSYIENNTYIGIKSSKDGRIHRLLVGAVVYMPLSHASDTFTYSDIEIIVSNKVLSNLVKESQISSFDMNVKEEYEEQIYNDVSTKFNNEIQIISRYEGKKSMQDAKTIMLVLGGGISLILGFIGIFNFINVISVGIMTRKHELAILESIGMSKRQVKSMLVLEGIGYAMITIICSLVIGNGITYISFMMFQHIAPYAQFSYPIVPIIVMYIIVILICCIVPRISYMGLRKENLVERLRMLE